MKHLPVMIKESIDILVNDKNGIYIDGTLGGGGHSKKIMSLLEEKGQLISFDQDEKAINRIKYLSEEDTRLKLIHKNFSNMEEVINHQGIKKVNGILLDLGISSMQLDDKSRGFSFNRDARLDMRMDQSQKMDAKIWINTSSESDIANTIFNLGEERMSRRIAKMIIQYREKKEIHSTKELADIISKAKGNQKKSKIHPATKSFQAIRIRINNELENLEIVLESMIKKICSGGKFVIITFHSLEDRIVKHFFNSHIQKMMSLQQGGEIEKGNKPYVKWVSKKPILPSDIEITNNPRSRSAKLRAITII
ncbi:MAG: 16S rRNA (cytosine(1402)-N(4))-methyltransferase RsmH [Pontiellaceae bacterium]